MIHATCCRSRGFRYDKLGDSIIVLERVEGDSKEQRSSSDQGSPEESLSFREENFLPISSAFLIFSFSLYLYPSLQRLVNISLCRDRRRRNHTSYTANKQVYIGLRIIWRRLYHVSRGTIFAPFNFDYESSRVTRVSTRDGGLRVAAIVGGNLRHSPPVSLRTCRG